MTWVRSMVGKILLDQLLAELALHERVGRDHAGEAGAGGIVGRGERQIEEPLGERHAERVLAMAGPGISLAIGFILGRVLGRDIGRVADDGVILPSEDRVQLGRGLGVVGVGGDGAFGGLQERLALAPAGAVEPQAAEQAVADGQVDVLVESRARRPVDRSRRPARRRPRDETGRSPRRTGSDRPRARRRGPSSRGREDCRRARAFASDGIIGRTPPARGGRSRRSGRSTGRGPGRRSRPPVPGSCRGGSRRRTGGSATARTSCGPTRRGLDRGRRGTGCRPMGRSASGGACPCSGPARSRTSARPWPCRRRSSRATRSGSSAGRTGHADPSGWRPRWRRAAGSRGRSGPGGRGSKPHRPPSAQARSCGSAPASQGCSTQPLSST